MTVSIAPAREVADLLGGEADLASPDDLDRRTAIAAIVITLLFWSANFTIYVSRSVMDGTANLPGLLLARTVTTAFGILVCFGIHLILQAMRNRAFWQRAIALVLTVPVAAEACAWCSYLTAQQFAPGAVGGVWVPSTVLQNVVSWSWFLLAWGALYLALRYNQEVQASERRARRIQGLAHAAQMRALHNQINPHFMFNTLNSIAALIMDRDLVASELMVTRLADFLRATLAIDPLVDIPLGEELAIQQRYLDIEQIRFPDLKVRIDCEDDATHAMVPPLILQPIIENAVKHGVAARRGQNTLTIAARREGKCLVLDIENERSPVAKPLGLGIGLRNVAARLAAHYGPGNFDFAAAPAGDDRYGVRISIPHRRQG